MPVLYVSNAIEVKETGNQRGRGVFARDPLPASALLFKESPLIAIQHQKNRAAGARVCERCFRFLGPLEDQIRSILVATGRSCAVVPSALPSVEGATELPAPVRCPGGCGLLFCSVGCAQANFAEQHQLLCPGPAQPSCASGSTAPPFSADGGLQALMSDMQISPLPEALARFEAHAAQSNEIFLLAAKAMALVLCSVRAGSSLEAALEHFPGPLWWEAIATPEDVADPEQFRLTLKQLVTESWQLLVPLLSPHAPAECASFIGDPLAYARIVGSFERRNCAVEVPVLYPYPVQTSPDPIRSHPAGPT
jgi:hypothetical protein